MYDGNERVYVVDPAIRAYLQTWRARKPSHCFLVFFSWMAYRPLLINLELELNQTGHTEMFTVNASFSEFCLWTKCAIARHGMGATALLG